MTDKHVETVVGHVPASWRIKRLEMISEFITKGGTPTTYGFEWADESDGIPFFRSECVTDAGFNPKGMNYIPVKAHLQMSRSEVKPGDLLMTITGNIGRVAKASDKYKTANINQHIARIRILEEAGVSAQYVYHCLKHDGYAAHYRAILTGQAYPQISLQQVRETPIALPNFAEQQKIAAILTAVDDKLHVISRQIDVTQTLKRGLMQTLFNRGFGIQDATGCWMPHTEFKDSELGNIPMGWAIRTLESVATVERGKFSARPRNDPKFFENGNIPFVQTGDIASSSRYVRQASQYLNAAGLGVSKQFPAETIFITIAANIGDVAIAKIAMACPDSLVGIRTTDVACDNTWLYYMLADNKAYFDSQSTQNAQKNINLQVLKPFTFAMPTVKEQQHIAGILSALDDKLDRLTSRHIHCQDLKRGLMQKLLTGEWRVKPDVEAITD